MNLDAVESGCFGPFCTGFKCADNILNIGGGHFLARCFRNALGIRGRFRGFPDQFGMRIITPVGELDDDAVALLGMQERLLPAGVVGVDADQVCPLSSLKTARIPMGSSRYPYVHTIFPL